MIIIAKSCNQPRCPSDCVSCSIVSDSAAPWAVALQAPLSTEFSRQDYWKVKGKVAQLSPTLSNPMDYTVHGILQARILEWVAFPFSTGCSQHRDHTQVSKAGRFFTSWATGKPKNTAVGCYSLLLCPSVGGWINGDASRKWNTIQN